MLKLHITKRFSSLTVDLDLHIPTQGITMIFGRSGAGKSSLLHMISGLTTPDKGQITLQDRILVDIEQRINLPVEKRQIGYVFQESRLFPHYRVKGNLQYGMSKTAADKFSAIVELLGLESLLTRYPLTLSGGEKQRVSIGRALLSSPQLLLMDEPLSALDLPRKHELMRYLLRLVKELHIPILYVTHSLDEMRILADKVVLLEKGKAAAYADLQTVWNNGALAEWQQTQTKQWLYQGELIAKTADSHAIIQVAQQHFRLALTRNYQLGEKVKIAIYQQDLFISLAPLAASSVMHQCMATVEKLVSVEQHLEVYLRIDRQMAVSVCVSLPLAQQLALVERQCIYLHILRLHIITD